MIHLWQLKMVILTHRCLINEVLWDRTILLTFAVIHDLLKSIRDLLKDSTVTFTAPGLWDCLGLSQHDDPGVNVSQLLAIDALTK